MSCKHHVGKNLSYSFRGFSVVSRCSLNPGEVVALQWFGGYVSTFPHEGFLVLRIR